jgi:pilus assembly protein CpaF
MNTEQGKMQLKMEDVEKLKKFLVDSITNELNNHPHLLQDRTAFTRELLAKAYENSKVIINENIKKELFTRIEDEVLGLGPLQPLLDDPEVTEIMVNGAKNIFVEKKGIITRSNVVFDNDSQVLKIIDQIISPLGRRIDADSPTVDARLSDGSRVNAIIPPVAIDGPSITIRKFSKNKLSVHDLINYGSLTPEMSEFIKACVVTKLNIIVSGGTGSGKTTLLNVLSGFIPGNERIITIEDAAELRMQQEHVVRCETKPPNSEGKNSVTIRDLVRNALRMRPDRIIVGEVRGGEALDMLQAMNTGHDGSITTLHANSARDTISRLETLCLMSGMELPLKVVRQQIASAIDLIIVQSRMKDGSRKIASITEVAGMEGETVTMSDIFKFEETGTDTEGKVIGNLKPTGIRPLFMHRLQVAGFNLSPEVFGASASQILKQSKK